MNRKITSLATLFAAGAFAAHAGVPTLSAVSAKSGADLSVTEIGCGGEKDGKCGGDKKKDGKCGGDKKGDHKKDGKCGGDKKKDGKCGGDKKGGKDASCGKGSCGSQKG